MTATYYHTIFADIAILMDIYLHHTYQLSIQSVQSDRQLFQNDYGCNYVHSSATILAAINNHMLISFQNQGDPFYVLFTSYVHVDITQY